LKKKRGRKLHLSKMPPVTFFLTFAEIILRRLYMEIITTILTLLIGFITVYIAYQQYKVNSRHQKWNMYNRQIAVVKTVREFIGFINQKPHDVDFNICLKFLHDSSEAVFLFSDKVQNYIDLLYKKCIKLEFLINKLHEEKELDNKERSEKKDLLSWFLNQPKESIELFQKKMYRS
jgi:hypothetical protein